MKLNRSDIIAKIFITAVIVILVGLLIAWMTGVFKDKRQNLNSANDKINNSMNAIADFDMLVYEGDTVNGDTLTSLISEVVSKNPELSIVVQTIANAKKATPVVIYYNKALNSSNAFDATGTVTTLDQSSKSNANYITPTANFMGKVLKNSNNEITGILFTQLK